MAGNEEAGRLRDLPERGPTLRALGLPSRDLPGPRRIVIQQSARWQPLALLGVLVLFLGAAALGHRAFRQLETQNRDAAVTMARVERKIQELQAGISYDSRRRLLLLGMRDHIMRTNSRVSLADAYRYAELAVDASEKYPVLDPLFLLAIGIVESGYDPMAKSPAGARGLYQIWPSTGRILARALGWSYEEASLYDPERNTQAAAFYLDVLFSTYNDPRMVLAEYNGGPLNAGYLRAGAPELARETRDYVPRVLTLYDRLKDEFDVGIEVQLDLMHKDAQREGKTLLPVTRRVPDDDPPAADGPAGVTPASRTHAARSSR
jgi:soluble lytic murein transglycosylase-like protein